MCDEVLNDAQISELKELIIWFENKLSEATKYKWDRTCPTLSPEHRSSMIEGLSARINIYNFYELYSAQTLYPRERIEKLIYYLFDIRMQLFFINEVDCEQYNQFFHNFGFDAISVNECPYKLLSSLSSDQTMIVKSRILWERIMNFIYYLETGNELENIKTKSKRGFFFQFIKDTKWSYLEDYKTYIDWYDERLRTPEVHKSSFLRKLFREGLSSDDNTQRMHGLVNIVMNMWSNVIDIVQGRSPRSRSWGIELGDPKPSWLPKE